MRIRAAVFSRLRNIARVRRFLTPPQCAMVVKSLVMSHFSYCATLLVGIDSRLMDKLQSALNVIVRLLHRLDHLDDVQEVLRAEGLLPVKSYVTYRLLLLLNSVLSSGRAQSLLSGRAIQLQ